MKASNYFITTLREAPAEAESTSHKLMLRAGLVRKLAAGIYCFLPIGYKVFRKIENIIREEMENAGALELFMSALLPAEAFRDSGRWDIFGPEMFRLKDRSNRDFCLGPTHEEIFTDMVKHEIRSYRSLPVMLYQIQTKFRDERRPRFGVIRSREFIMKDAYSFDKNEAGLDISYNKMYSAYCKIFDRCKLDYIAVQADTGAMGGSGSQEFMVKSEIGENTIALCESCGYAANDEKAECVNTKSVNTNNEINKEFLELEKIHTPNTRTIEEIINLLDCSSKKVAKTLIYMADKKVIAAMVRGDRELNEAKLKTLLGCTSLEMADPETVSNITNAAVGFAGPVNLINIDIVVDEEVSFMKNIVTGANTTDYHFKNVNINRDFSASIVADIRTISQGDACPVCGKPITLTLGIEVGHIFKLGTKYSKALNCIYLDDKGQEIPMVMGSYGIGLNRTMAAIIEQNNDENGIIWPMSVAPYHVVIIPAKLNDSTQINLAESIYNKLVEHGLDVILDDRDERTGVKFKDADLIGIPIRITVGRKAVDGIVEVKERKNQEVVEMNTETVIEFCKEKVILK